MEALIGVVLLVLPLLTLALENGVSTTSGIIFGHAAPNTSEVMEFLGIPFASPPTGDKRFLPPSRFHSTANFNASAYGPSCPAIIGTAVAFPNRTSVFDNVYLAFTTQGGNIQSEDCLSLNIWAGSSKSKPKPVLVFFPGGRWNIGGSKSTIYAGQYLAATEDIIVVTINFRLNIFGFPGAPGITQNSGLLDQRMAVEWLRDNIAAFGGNPGLITIFGQSAGSVSAGYYAYSFKDDPIIAGSIMESGTPHSWTPLTPALGAQHWYDASAAAGCGSSGDTLACMQALNFTSVLTAFAQVPFDPTNALPQPQFQPVVDNITVFQDYNTLAAAGDLAKVPTLIGNNNFESGFYQIAAFADAISFNATEQALFNLEAFTCASAIEASARISLGVPTWRYRYFGDWANLRLFPGSGTYHGSELEMVFGTAATVSGVPSTETENNMSAYFMKAWATFASDPKAGLGQKLGWPLYANSSASPTLVRLGYNNQTIASFGLPGEFDLLCPLLRGATDLGKGAM